MVYLGAALPLRLLPWDESAPAFNVNALRERERRVQPQFETLHVVYVGGYEKCSCAFQVGDGEDLEPDEYERRRGCLRDFAAYLRSELARVGRIEVHACWDGEQADLPENRRVLTPDSLEAPDFHFLPKEHSVFEIDAHR